MMNPMDFWTILTVGMFVYSLPYDDILKLTFQNALDYTGLMPALGGW